MPQPRVIGQTRTDIEADRAHRRDAMLQNLGQMFMANRQLKEQQRQFDTRNKINNALNVLEAQHDGDWSRAVRAKDPIIRDLFGTLYGDEGLQMFDTLSQEGMAQTASQIVAEGHVAGLHDMGRGAPVPGEPGAPAPAPEQAPHPRDAYREQLAGLGGETAVRTERREPTAERPEEVRILEDDFVELPGAPRTPSPDRIQGTVRNIGRQEVRDEYGIGGGTIGAPTDTQRIQDTPRGAGAPAQTREGVEPTPYGAVRQDGTTTRELFSRAAEAVGPALRAFFQGPEAAARARAEREAIQPETTAIGAPTERMTPEQIRAQREAERAEAVPSVEEMYPNYRQFGEQDMADLERITAMSGGRIPKDEETFRKYQDHLRQYDKAMHAYEVAVSPDSTPEDVKVAAKDLVEDREAFVEMGTIAPNAIESLLDKYEEAVRLERGAETVDVNAWAERNNVDPNMVGVIRGLGADFVEELTDRDKKIVSRVAEKVRNNVESASRQARAGRTTGGGAVIKEGQNVYEWIGQELQRDPRDMNPLVMMGMSPEMRDGVRLREQMHQFDEQLGLTKEQWEMQRKLMAADLTLKNLQLQEFEKQLNAEEGIDPTALLPVLKLFHDRLTMAEEVIWEKAEGDPEKFKELWDVAMEKNEGLRGTNDSYTFWLSKITGLEMNQIQAQEAVGRWFWRDFQPTGTTYAGFPTLMPTAGGGDTGTTGAGGDWANRVR